MKINKSKFKKLFPFKSHYKLINNFRYHYIDKGEGSPIIMVHGNPTWSFYFRRLINDLSDNYRTIAVDHIGCGLSDKPSEKDYQYTLQNRVDDLENFIEQLDFNEKITLIVHDWGGMIASAYALKYPDKIYSLIITNTSGFFPPSNKSLPFRLWLFKKFRSFAKIGILKFNMFARCATFMASSKGLSKEVKDGLTAPYEHIDNRIATLKFVQDIPVDKKDPSYNLVKYVDDNLYKLSTIPMLICWGMGDFVFDPDYLKEWEKRFPKAQVHTFPDAGHYLLEDEPVKVSKVIKTFLETVYKNQSVSAKIKA